MSKYRAGVEKSGSFHPGHALRGVTQKVKPQVTTQIAHPHVRGEGVPGVETSTFSTPADLLAHMARTPTPRHPAHTPAEEA